MRPSNTIYCSILNRGLKFRHNWHIRLFKGLGDTDNPLKDI